MLILNADGSIMSSNQPTQRAQSRRGYLELAAPTQVDQPWSLSALLALAFDQLGLHDLELRIREEE